MKKFILLAVGLFVGASFHLPAGAYAQYPQQDAAGPQAGNQGYYGSQPGANQGLSPEQMQQLQQARQQFIDQTQDLRSQIQEKQSAIGQELNQENPDRSKLMQTQKELDQLRSEYEQKALDYHLQVRKIAPNLQDSAGPYGRGGPGPGNGYGRGPGMMGNGQGPGMMGGYGNGPGMMGGNGGGPGMMGRGYGSGSGPYKGQPRNSGNQE